MPFPQPAVYADWKAWAQALLRELSVNDSKQTGDSTVGVTRPKRLHGPALVSNAAATKYTVPAGARTELLYIHVQNPTGGAVTFTLSIGADAAGTRLYDAFSIAANSVLSQAVYFVLEAGEIIQALSGTNNVLTLTLDGKELSI